MYSLMQMMNRVCFTDETEHGLGKILASSVHSDRFASHFLNSAENVDTVISIRLKLCMSYSTSLFSFCFSRRKLQNKPINLVKTKF